MKRYEIMPHSQSAHCCFEYTIVDTTKPRGYTDSNGLEHFDGVCECFELAEAELICKALNEMEARSENR